MKRRIRIRGVFKWLGVGLCVFLAALWIVGLTKRIKFSTGGTWYAETIPGGVVLELYLFGTRGGFEFGDYYFDLFNHRHLWWPGQTWTSSMTKYVYVPIWIFLLPTAFATAWLWRSDRRPMSGCVQCGYNLTGNVSGVCPECGTEI